MPDEKKIHISCRPVEGNLVDFSIGPEGDDVEPFKLPADLAMGVAAALLGALRATGDANGAASTPDVGEAIGRTMVVDSSAVGVSQSGDGKTTALILQFGTVRLGVRLARAQVAEMARALSEIANSNQ